MRPVAIRREDKNAFEARAPLTPMQVRHLVDAGVPFIVQPSEQRVFDDADYRVAGARVEEDLSEAGLVLGVKEIPADKLLERRAHLFFSHTIKGQPYNMPLLRAVLEREVSLLDYECITDERGLRLIAFGKQAGQAGAIDTLWALGRRLAAEGHETALAELEPAWRYDSLDEARSALRRAGELLAKEGLPNGLPPLTVGVLGGGRVASGAWEILDSLGARDTPVERLDEVASSGSREGVVHKVVLLPEHYVARKSDGGFEFAEYLEHPERYVSTIEGKLPHLVALVNGIYWDERYPRLVTRAWLRRVWADPLAPPRLRVLGDISCDIRGSIEATVKATTPEAPTYVYDPKSDEALEGFEGPGPLVLAVDNLPCELPREASESFGGALMPFVAPMAAAVGDDGRLDPERLPPEIARSLIAHAGRLEAPFAYLGEHLAAEGR